MCVCEVINGGLRSFSLHLFLWIQLRVQVILGNRLEYANICPNDLQLSVVHLMSVNNTECDLPEVVSAFTVMRVEDCAPSLPAELVAKHQICQFRTCRKLWSLWQG